MRSALANTGLGSPYDVGAERYDVLHDGRDVQPYSDLRATRERKRRQRVQVQEGLELPLLAVGGTHVGDDSDEGVRNGEGEALRRPRLEALLHQREAVLAAEQADVAQQVQGDLHVLGKGHMTRLNGLNSNSESMNLGRIQLKKVPLRAEMTTEEG